MYWKKSTRAVKNQICVIFLIDFSLKTIKKHFVALYLTITRAQCSKYSSMLQIVPTLMCVTLVMQDLLCVNTAGHSLIPLLISQLGFANYTHFALFRLGISRSHGLLASGRKLTSRVSKNKFMIEYWLPVWFFYDLITAPSFRWIFQVSRVDSGHSRQF